MEESVIPELALRSTLIICTKDRPSEVARCLRSVERSTLLPDVVLVVDSSRSADTRLVVSGFSSGLLQNVHWIGCEPGLTKQRNHGVKLADANTDIIHFVDDDVVVHRDYFAELSKAFAAFPDAVGIGGRITDLPDAKPWHRVRAARREGSVSRSGINHISGLAIRSGVREVAWLSGCSMSFRRQAIIDLKFDESRTGNGVGEDVDFCLRISTKGTILWVADAMVEHRQSSINRYDPRRAGREQMRHRMALAGVADFNVSRRRVILRGFGEAAGRLIRAFTSRSRNEWEYAVGLIAGVLPNVRR